MEEVKNKGGRPIGAKSKYKADMPKRAYDVLAKGGLLCHVAAELNIDRSTVAAWLKDPEKKRFKEFVNLGLALSEAEHCNRLMRIAKEGRGNVTAQLRIMEWAFQWKNVSTVETLTPEKEMTAEEIERRIAALGGTSNVVNLKK